MWYVSVILYVLLLNTLRSLKILNYCQTKLHSNNFRSPAWTEFKKSFADIYSHAREHGWWATYEIFVEKLDPVGEQHAKKVIKCFGTEILDDLFHYSLN